MKLLSFIHSLFIYEAVCSYVLIIFTEDHLIKLSPVRQVISVQLPNEDCVSKLPVHQVVLTSLAVS